MINPKKILIIIQRSNGDVFLSLSLINALYNYYKFPQIDLLVNDDTLAVARLLPHVKYIHTFSYQKKSDKRWNQEREIICKIYGKYDLSINLTASDRSVIYALLAGKKSISAIEETSYKSWWKKLILSHFYFFNINRHIVLNNLEPLNILGIKTTESHEFTISDMAMNKVKKMLKKMKIDKFIIFHPSAQYNFKIYPKHLRNQLLTYLNTLGIPILITGTKNKIDLSINKELPNLPNIYNLIGRTSIEEYCALSSLSLSYIGMDTLNMHIAAIQDKRIFAISGPTNLKMWAPWSNDLKKSDIKNLPIQSYGKITIFQSFLPCVPCGNAGCDDKNRSECLYTIWPKDIFYQIKKWYANESFL